jgi:biopolymer transport protein ExbB/TolQ
VTFGCKVVWLLIDFLFVCLPFSKWFFVVVLQENFDELTWETYKGPLTEKQQKMIEKVHKRHEKMANLKKENDAIQAKEIGQGGLTQGQQTQMARNEQRIEQLMDELESLEETLNESIQESVGARTGKVTSKKKPVFEDEEDDVRYKELNLLWYQCLFFHLLICLLTL